ncbi:hypothetical protein AAFF_G00342870 [Aldrovandia affinis]|uniref:Uncharacterized protein n=1 Tax=Aldrovandia affinis TaxID=143900 RepID=A0AAD7SJS1_9TELE|nr:hypothetical protein AAFF_G00342870 [Aldrovandia affinis]
MPSSVPSLRMALPSYSSVTSTCRWRPLRPLHSSPCFSPLTSPWLNPHPPTRPVTNWTWSSPGTAPHPTLRYRLYMCLTIAFCLSPSPSPLCLNHLHLLPLSLSVATSALSPSLPCQLLSYLPFPLSYRTTCLIPTNLGSEQATPQRLLSLRSLRLFKGLSPNPLAPSSSSSTCRRHSTPWTTGSCSHLSSRWESLDLR